ncbi:hypothetical protein GQ55_9G580400 [Panicum hallii var. hallii]|uniref:Uncharacterized protein n=1 Tax=Panicum hallii var. hallii TaxID=1504633 RepID=A0A2T7CGF9_9POAL|nr:hypothetical protein GQ55_9G580400 [Panicum hallii var. hallii]
MEPTKQGVPADPSSSQQQPHLPPAPLPPPQPYPPPPALPQQQRDVQPPQPPMLLLPPEPPQGLAPTAAHGVLWQPQQFVGVRPYLPMPQPQPQPQQFVVEPRSRSPAPAIPRKLTLEDVGFVGSSPCLVRLLKEGCEVVRRIVFDGVMGALHFAMGSSAWRVVFVELLRAGSFDELKVIVNVACESAPRAPRPPPPPPPPRDPRRG